ncbi:hypothetical protein SEMRO_1070_G237750.1 [Seminavis robusta]|uniref:Uncharacterized protein n=1 Tax=Seminavis robusta TaxID=568900 RepID=A0A9N8EJR6_9STRA|nr:hypothetical protein SEMRO_1070_G237750.1 [Seminavis robusta]|eukprot:Sro1070_g237750.1 n/a (118) ;mRNA; f:20204-20557
MIQWKQGPHPLAPYNDKVKQKKADLLQLWQEKYAGLEAPAGGVWTEDDEAELERLGSGEITCFSKDVGIDRCIETEDDYLITRLLSIDRKRRNSIVGQVLQRVEEEEANEIIAASIE